MSFDSDQFRLNLVRPILKDTAFRNNCPSFYSRDAEELLLLTCAQETLYGRYLKQISGPGLSVFSIEPATFAWLQNTHKAFLVERNYRLESYTPSELLYNLRLAIVVTRLRYWVVKAALPKYDDVQGMADYWDKYYNGNPNKGFPKDAIRNYRTYVSPVAK